MRNTKRERILTLVAILAALGVPFGCIGLDDGEDFSLPPIYEPPGSGEDEGGQDQPINQPPEARVQLDRDFFLGGETITLDASQSSDPESDPLTFQWGMIAKASVHGTLSQDEIADIILDEPDSALPSFIAPRLGSMVRYNFAVTVRDNWSNSDVAYAAVTVEATGPIADAGPDQIVTVGNVVTLDATASYHFFDGEITEYLWQQMPMPDVRLVDIDDAESAVTTFEALEVGENPVTLRFILLVYGETNDGRISSSDWMEVTVLPEAYIPPPIADAGEDQHNPLIGELVTLDGSGSQIPSGGQATYTWTQVSPAEPVLNFDLSDPLHPTFIAPSVSLRTIFTIQLEVYDDLSQQSATDTMIVAVLLMPDPDPNPDPDPGTDGFTEQVIDDQFVHGQNVEPVDIDNDGDIDIIAASSLTDAVRLYLNDGTGQNWTTVEISGVGAIVAMDVCTCDIDNDGDLDIAAVGLFDRSAGFSSPGEVVWYENPGVPTGMWTTHRVTDPRFRLWGTRSIECLDLSGNGYADLVVGAVPVETDDGTLGNGLYSIFNVGGGSSWHPPLTIDAGLQGVEKILRHDIDGDGVQDVLALGRLGNEIAWYRTVPNGSEASFEKHVIATPLLPYDIELANIDQDADLELLVTTPDYSVGLASYDPTADPNTPWTLGTIDAAFDGFFARIATADFNGDRRPDIAVASNDTAELRVYTKLPGGGWSAETIATGYDGLTDIAAADLDGANGADLLTATYARSAGDRISWWRNEP